MKKTCTLKFLLSSIALFSVCAVAMVLWGQGDRTSHNRIPLAEDWSHRHLIFSSPASVQQERQLQQQYRYWNQWYRRNARVQMPAADKAASLFAQPQSQRGGVAFAGVPNRNDKNNGGSNAIAGGSSAAMAIAAAEHSGPPGALSWRQRRWAIYAIRLLLAALFLLALALGIKETRRRRLAFGFALGLTAAFLALEIGCAGGNSASTPQPVTAQSLQRDWSSSLTANATVGAGMFPAKFTFDITAAPSCTNDFVVFTTGLSSGATTVDIAAFNQLYSGTGGICSGPTVLWAYQTTSAAGATVTSPVLSLDGTQVAFVEGTGGTGVLHILRPGTGVNAGTLAAPASPMTSTSGAVYNTCKLTAGNACLLNLAFANASDDSFSPPFPDYRPDALYVGDNGGNLHQFTGVFNGTAAETTTAPWPIAVNPGSSLNGPVKDDTSGNIFVTDVNGTLSYVRDVGSTVGTCSSGSPPCLGSTKVVLTSTAVTPHAPLITDPPVVDTTQGRVFAFTGHGNLQMSTLPLLRGANVFQADTALSPASVIDLDLGQGDSWPLYSGAFDNAYLTSVATGHLYVCANSGTLTGAGSGVATDNFPTLKRILFNANGTMSSVDTSTSATGALVTLTAPAGVFSGSSPCSPVTEVLNGATDWLFMSVQFSGSQLTCGGNGCVVSVVATAPTSVNATLPESGGTSGIVVDNVSGVGQASSIYFSILANSTATPPLTCNGTGGVGCAVKATQSGLK